MGKTKAKKKVDPEFYKTKGNAAFAKGDNGEALEFYT